MDKPILVHVVEANDGLDEEEGRLVFSERLNFLDPVEQITLRSVLQDQIEELTILQTSIQAKNIWMFQLLVNCYLSSEYVQNFIVLNLVKFFHCNFKP